MAVSAFILIGFLAVNIALFWHFRSPLWRALLGPAALVEARSHPAQPAGLAAPYRPRRAGAQTATPPVSRLPLRLVA